MAGEGVVRLAVDQKADGGDLRKSGVKGSDDGLHGEGFDEDAGGVVVNEGAVKVDDSELTGLFPRARLRIGEEEDVVDGGTALERVRRTWQRVGGEKVLDEGAGASGGLLR
jgi:hypothetical protein